MTDRELLEAAAKAAGYVHAADHVNAGWNPLTDDGDALRLAVKLGLTINPYKRGIFVSRDEDEPVITEEWSDDDYAATRRAIVRAAAWLAKDMK